MSDCSPSSSCASPLGGGWSHEGGSPAAAASGSAQRLQLYRFDSEVTIEALEEALDCEGFSGYECAVQPDARQIAVYCAGRLPETITAHGVEGRLVPAAGPAASSCTTVWFLPPPLDAQAASSKREGWKGFLNHVLRKNAAYTEAVLDAATGAPGATFHSAAEAQRFIETRKGKLQMNFPETEGRREYSLSLAPCAVGVPGVPLQPVLQMPGVAHAPRSAHSVPTPPEPPPPPSAVHPAAPELLPPGPGVVRVRLSPGHHRDVPVEPGDVMAVVYDEIHKDEPLALLGTVPDGSRAVLRGDKVDEDEFREVVLLPCTSLPLVLPTEFHVQVGEAGEREPGFAHATEVLCHSLREYTSWKEEGSCTYIFRHRREAASRSRLIVMSSALRHLDATVIRGRKVGFLSVIGKPREGKSTLLTLMGWHFKPGDGRRIFRCSDSTQRACTAGLWVSTTELTQCCLREDKSQKDPASIVLLLDSEGLFADDGNEPKYFVHLFTVVAVLSSVLILNNKISNTVEEGFKAFLARFAALYRDFFKRNPWFFEQKPRVVYLARDWNKVQSLSDDRQSWEQVTDKCGVPGSPMGEVLAFVHEAFGYVNFATLPSPVADVNKENVVAKTLDPGFQDKLQQILREVVGPNLQPKSFGDSASGAIGYITGAGPLEQLLSSVVGAPPDGAWDWDDIMKRLLREAAMAELVRTAQTIVEHMEELFSCFDAVPRGGLGATHGEAAASALKEAAAKAGVKALQSTMPSEGDSLHIRGRRACVSAFLQGFDAASFQLRLPALERWGQEVLTAKDAVRQQVFAKFQPFNCTPETAADLLDGEVERRSRPLFELIMQMAQVEVQQILGNFDAEYRRCTTVDAVGRCQQGAIAQLHTLLQRACADAQLAKGVEEAEEHVKQRSRELLERPSAVVRSEVDRHFAQRMGLRWNDHASLSAMVQGVEGEQLFSYESWAQHAHVQTEAIMQQEDQVLYKLVRCVMDLPGEFAFAQAMPPEDVHALLYEHRQEAEAVLLNERRRRLCAELMRLAAPLSGSLGDLAAAIADELLSSGAAAGPSIMKVLKTRDTAAQGRDSTDIFLSIAETRRRLEHSPASNAELGDRWAACLSRVLKETCDKLELQACGEYQVALFGESQEHLRGFLRENVGIQACNIEPFGGAQKNLFRVALPSKEDLDTLLMRQADLKLFNRMGFRPPADCWVSEFSARAREQWRQHVSQERPVLNRIFYKSTFEEVANLYNEQVGNQFWLGSEAVEVGMRFSLVLYPVRFDLQAKVLESQLGPGSKCDSIARLGKDGRVVCVTVMAPRALRDQFRTPRKLVFPTGSSVSSAVICAPPNRNWVWSWKPPDDMAKQWALVQAEVSERIIQTLAAELAQGAEHSAVTARIPELMHEHGLEDSESLTREFQAVLADFQSQQADALGRQLFDRLCSFAGRSCKADVLDVPSSILRRAATNRKACSEQEAVWTCLGPAAAELESEVAASEDRTWLEELLGRPVDGETLLAGLQEQLHSRAEQRVGELAARERLLLVANIMGIGPESRKEFFAEATSSKLGESAIGVEGSGQVAGLAALVFKFGGRRYVPLPLCAQLAQDEGVEAQPRELDSAAALVRSISDFLCSAQECRLPEGLAGQLGLHLGGSAVVARRFGRGPGSGLGDTYFMLRDPDAVFRRLFELAPLGCEVVRQVPCLLRSKLSLEDAYEHLDKLRPMGAFVTSLQEDGEHVLITLSVWHISLHKLPLEEFMVTHMKLVSKSRSCSCKDAFPVSVAEAVFFAESFDMLQPRVPLEFARHARDLKPLSFRAPPAVPEAAMDIRILKDSYQVLDSDSIGLVRGRSWDSAACIGLMHLCQGDRDAEQALRVMVMAHTQAVCEAGWYCCGGQVVQAPAPHRSRTFATHAVRASYSLQTRAPQRLPERTEVVVSNKDTLGAVAGALRRNPNARVLALNMANRQSPGGGYKKGSFAQEEDFFRRTTLSASLDDPSGRGPAYPLPECTSVISTGIVAFRGSEEEGYPLLAEPFPFDVISVPAYNGNERRGGQIENFRVLEGGQGEARSFTEEGFWRTFCNIKNLLQEAAAAQPDHLVLGALGCGAFSNPSREVAAMFKELLRAHGGCFKCVEFAIYDTSKQPDGNFQTFHRVLQSVAVLSPPASDSALHDLRLFPHSKICLKLGLCDQMGVTGHAQTHWHPDFCERRESCEDTSLEHRRLRRHKLPCREQSCKIMFGPDTAEKRQHTNLYTHKKLCRIEQCSDGRHLHPPPCRNAMRCDKLGREHEDGFYYSHTASKCKFGTFCTEWDNQEHLAMYSHPFAAPCHDAIWCPLKEDAAHVAGAAHLCPHGNECKFIGEPTHIRRWIHKRRPCCPEGAACDAMAKQHYDDHVDMFQHPKVRQFRPLCPCRGHCAAEHVQKFAHPMPAWSLPVCAVYGHNTLRHLMEEKEKPYEVDFHNNAKAMIARVRRHFPGQEPNPDEVKQAMQFFSRCRPVHRLPVVSFGKVLHTGFLASLHLLQRQSKESDLAVQLPSVVKALRHRPDAAAAISDFVVEVVRHSAAREQFERTLKRREQDQRQEKGKALEAGALGGPKATLQKHANEVKRHSRILERLVDVSAILKEVKSFLAAMQQLQKDAGEEQQDEEKQATGDKVQEADKFQAIGWKYDRIFETNKMNFAISGPHTLNYGEDKEGGDPEDQGVHLVFQANCQLHPDCFLTPTCATFYHSKIGDEHRPWRKQDRPAKEDAFKAMAAEKLHPSSPLCHEALAMDFLARVALIKGKPLADATMKEIMEYWRENNAHYVVECHLPYATPLTWVERVIVSEHSFEKLTAHNKELARTVFRERLGIVKGHKSSDVQYDAAWAQLPWPSLPPSFAWTLMPVRSSEVVLPVTLPARRCRIFFRASAPHFVVTLASGRNQRGLQHPYSIKVEGERCCITKPGSQGSPSPEQKCERFNRDLRASLAGIFYCIEVDGKGGSILVRHAGASRTFNSQELVVRGVSQCPTVVSFSVRAVFIEFTDVRVHVGDNDEHLLEHERICEVGAVECSPPVSVAVAQEADLDKGRIARWLGSFPGIGYFLGRTSAEPKKQCCNQGLGCRVAFPLARSLRTDAERAHLEEFRHLCLYGQSCKRRGESDHDLQYMHMEKTECPASDMCSNLEDLDHRMQYHHRGRWDLLLPCRDGSRCRNRTAGHCQEYHHHDFEYRIDDTLVQLTPFGARGMALESQGAAAAAQHPESKRCVGSASSGHLDDLVFAELPGEVQDRLDDGPNIYNQAAMVGDYKGAQLDIYGSPVGGAFDLVKDNSFRGYKVLVGCFYQGANLPGDLQALTIPELRKKGFEVQVCSAVDEFTKALGSFRPHVAWIISSNTFGAGDQASFVEEVKSFHEAGRGLMIWGDNAPYFVHANLILEKLFGFKLMGNTPGGTELVPGQASQAGHFDRSHKVCAGIEKLHEGVTICYPDQVPPGWGIFGTSSNSRPVLLAKEASSERPQTAGTGRVVVDNGFTKLYKRFWTTAGTPRYVSNSTAWLVLWERFRGPNTGFAPPPRAPYT